MWGEGVSEFLVFLGTVNTWISNHRDLLTLLFVPLLTLFVTSFSGRMSASRASEERHLEREIAKATRKLERELARKLKLAEFRQSWINGLREEIAVFTSLTLNPEGRSREEANQVNLAQAKIIMRLNSNEIKARELISAMEAVVWHTKQEDLGQYQAALVSAGQGLLKHEWDRLKDELADIQNEEQK
jgi:hypothetical protein